MHSGRLQTAALCCEIEDLLGDFIAETCRIMHDIDIEVFLSIALQVAKPEKILSQILTQSQFVHPFVARARALVAAKLSEFSIERVKILQVVTVGRHRLPNIKHL